MLLYLLFTLEKLKFRENFTLPLQYYYTVIFCIFKGENNEKSKKKEKLLLIVSLLNTNIKGN